MDNIMGQQLFRILLDLGHSLPLPKNNCLLRIMHAGLTEKILEAKSLSLINLLLVAQSDGVFDLLLLCHLLHSVVSSLSEITSRPH